MPRPTGETDAGEPIYAIRSARLVLRGDAAHFNRLVPCSNCGRDVVGPALLGPGDLDQPVEPVTCDDCRAKGLSPASVTAERAPAPAVDSRVEDLDRRLAELTALVDTLKAERDGAVEVGSEATETELATVATTVEQLTTGQQELREALQGAVERVEQVAAERLDGSLEEMDGRIKHLQAEVGDVVGRVTADLAGAGAATEELARAQALLAERIDTVAASVDQLPAGFGATVTGRLDRLEERTALAAASDAARLHALEGRMGEVSDGLAGLDQEATRVAGRLAESLASQADELRAVLADGLAEVRSTAAAPAADVSARLQALEKRMQRIAAEMSELGELHAALDAGMGALRSEIIEVRAAVTRVAGGQADVEDRLEAIVRAPALAAESGKGRKARKGEAGAQASAVLVFTDDLARELQQVKAHVATLQQAADAATATAARASAQAAASSPFRSDVRRLQEHVEAQDEALESLLLSVERLRKKGDGAPPAAKPSRPSTKR